MEILQESNRNPIAIAKKSHKNNHRHIMEIPPESNRNHIASAKKYHKNTVEITEKPHETPIEFL